MIIAKRDLVYNKYKDKGVMFFSAGSPQDCKMLLKAGINEQLVSYYYLRKRKKIFESEILPKLYENDGLFMTDSGGFSFLKQDSVGFFKPEFWIPYLEEYVQWLWEFKKYIFVAVNLDLDFYVGHKVVSEWNEKYFKPLEPHMNIIYLSHPDKYEMHSDKEGLFRVKEDFKEFHYVGVNNKYTPEAHIIYQLSKRNKNLVHGFGWTSIPTLKRYPFFSVDSTTWLGGQRYGTSYIYDGRNFRVYAGAWKFLRRRKKEFCRLNGIDYEGLVKEKTDAVNHYNLMGWLGARKEYLRLANQKLWNKPVACYERNRGRFEVR